MSAAVLHKYNVPLEFEMVSVEGPRAGEVVVRMPGAVDRLQCATDAEVRSLLPAGTPTILSEQRERIIRERRAAYQQRPLW